MIWLLPSEISQAAEAGLMPGLPCCKRSVNRLAEVEGWGKQSGMSRLRGGVEGSGGFEYHITCLPQEARLKWVSHHLNITAISAGFPFIKTVLEGRFGDNGKMAGEIIKAIADRARIPVSQVEDAIRENPQTMIDIVREVDRMAPEFMSLYAKEIEVQKLALEAEQDDPVWMRAWRPGWMYLLGFLWLWNLVILHIANAVWKIALPPQEMSDLLALTGMFLALYMGGHTVLRLMSQRGGNK